MLSLTFYDNGGPAANYANNSIPAASAVTFAPSNNPNNKIRVNFSSHSTEAQFDALYIRDGNTQAAPLFASANPATLGGFPAGGWYGTQLTGLQFQAGPANPTGALNFSFGSDGSVSGTGWAATITEFFQPPCLTAPANITVGTNQNSCDATPNLNLPGQSTPGCATTAGFFIRYQVNGGAFVNIAQPYPANVAVGPLTPGIAVITWQLLDAAGAIQNVVTNTVTVIDNVLPTITCPPNIFSNLDPGLCCQIFSWPEPAFSDNCLFAGYTSGDAAAERSLHQLLDGLLC
ncbi:MAG: hypothetical protein IPK76_08930 [Lewinellaceae bacterium]|nr:hypothetical protein [Lewinellaceae bacterium]